MIDDQSVNSVGQALKNVSGAVGQPALQTPVYNSNYIRGFAAEQYLDGMTTYLQSGDPNSFADVERLRFSKAQALFLTAVGSERHSAASSTSLPKYRQRNGRRRSVERSEAMVITRRISISTSH